jgi:hypothetical protein
MHRLRIRSSARFVEKLEWAVRNGSLTWYMMRIRDAKHRISKDGRDLRKLVVMREARHREKESRLWRKSLLITNSLISACNGKKTQK